MAERKGRGSRPDRSRLYGVVICGTTLAIAAALLEGVRRRSYWALAAPLLVGSLGVLSVAFWIGWALVTTRLELAAPETGSDRAPAGRRRRSVKQPSAN
jgi:hypothetical protein